MVSATTEPESARPVWKRAPGLAFLAALIGVGMLIPAFFRWKYFELERDRDEMLAAAPSEPAARLALWFEHGQPRILEALHSARFSNDRRWIVSHVVAPVSEGVPPEIWGIEESVIEPGVVQLDGLVVRVVLPAPELLERDVLVGDNAVGVEVFAPPGPKDASVLIQRRIEFVLKRLINALPQDIEGASISVDVGPNTGSAARGAGGSDG